MTFSKKKPFIIVALFIFAITLMSRESPETTNQNAGATPRKVAVPTAESGPLTGKYIVPEKVGTTAQLFAPGIVSTTDHAERDMAFSADFKELYFSRDSKIHYMKKENGAWGAAKPAPFPGKYHSVEACFSPDGGKLFFISTRPESGSGKEVGWEIQFVERKGQNWGPPQLLGSPFQGACYPTFTKDWVMYFTSKSWDLYYSKYRNGVFSEPVKLSNNVNTPKREYNAFIAPDESYLIFSSRGWDVDSGISAMFISFRGKDGSWTQARNIRKFNAGIYGGCPSVSPDGKYLFFTSGRLGTEDIFWVDADVIRQMKPKDLK
ncbi:MAG: hypothetical protein GY765_32845 [bacterium]|nr:hypothetical protein [bacterium]